MRNPDRNLILSAAREAAALREALADTTAGAGAAAGRDPGSSAGVDPQPGVTAAPALDGLSGYRITRELHRGGQGVVYHAIHENTRREVAIKVMRHGPFAAPAERARFEREVRILGQLNHPSIVAVRDAGVVSGCDYFVMDYVAGRSLDACGGAQRPMRETLELFARVCDAVHAAHVRGIIHRDLKPANIRVDASGWPHVLDFGLAKTLWSAPEAGGLRTMTGDFVGSLPWASPEQAAGDPSQVDVRADVYALGVILYQMLTGTFPYAVVGNLRDVVEHITSTTPTPPRQIRREIGDEVETIVLKALAKDRERRYQTAGELGRDIRRHLAGEPVEAKRDSAIYLLGKLMQRYRVAATLAVAFLLAGVAMGAAMTVMYQRAVREADHARQLALVAAQAEARAQQETARIRANLEVAEDVQDVPAEERHAGDDDHKRYFLIGPRAGASPPPAGYRLLLILPGGDGSADFHSFARRIFKQGLPDGYLAAQLVAPQWSKAQFEQVVWPTRTNPWPQMKFSTEEFIESVVEDVARQHKLDRSCVLAMGWSSGGPPCYATALSDKTPVTGVFAAMSIFTPGRFPPLANARGRSFAILHSPDDTVVPPEHAQRALDQLRRHGAAVKYIDAPGGHGWRGNVYGNIRAAIEWLEGRDGAGTTQASTP